MLRYVVPALGLFAAASAAAPRLAPGFAQEDVRTEAARIERRLERIEAQVLGEDAELRRMNEALGAELLAAMEGVQPGVADDARRLAALRVRSAGEGIAAALSSAEVRRLEARVDAARSAALRQRRLASMAAAFRLLLRERMIRADPEAGPLLERYAELHRGSGAREP